MIKNFLLSLALLFIALKLMSYIFWSWLWILFPLIVALFIDYKLDSIRGLFQWKKVK